MPEDYTELMENVLCELKMLGAIALKAEFEEEAADYREVEKIKTLARKAGLKLALKLGGCSAYRDMKDAKKLEADIIIAPMIESAYALKKFCAGVKIYGLEKKELYICIETINAMNALDEITHTEEFGGLDGFVFGRTDYTRSANSDDCFEAAELVSKAAATLGKSLVIGGNISSDAIHFLNSISLYDRFETRKVVFDKNIALKYNNAINKALEFEILWLKSIGQPYSQKRISELEKRLSIN